MVKMKRPNLSFPENLDSALTIASRQDNMTKSEIAQKALKEYLVINYKEVCEMTGVIERKNVTKEGYRYTAIVRPAMDNINESPTEAYKEIASSELVNKLDPDLIKAIDNELNNYKRSTTSISNYRVILTQDTPLSPSHLIIRGKFDSYESITGSWRYIDLRIMATGPMMVDIAQSLGLDVPSNVASKAKEQEDKYVALVNSQDDGIAISDLDSQEMVAEVLEELIAKRYEHFGVFHKKEKVRLSTTDDNVIIELDHPAYRVGTEDYNTACQSMGREEKYWSESFVVIWEDFGRKITIKPRRV